jgi:zeta-carotene desaturase
MNDQKEIALNSTTNKVAIIGAGVAGINAARFLMNSGVDFDMYEASPEIGGRASRIYDNKAEEYIDNGQHLLSGAYDEFLGLLNYLGTEDLVKRPKGLVVPYIDVSQNIAITDKLDTSKAWGKLGTLKGLLDFDLFNKKDKYSIIRLAVRIQLGISQAFDEETCDVFLRRQKQTERAIEVFWEPLILAVLNTSVRQASAILLKRVCELAFFASKKKASLLFPKTELRNILEPVLDKIKQSGSNLYTKAKIKAIDNIDGNDRLTITTSKGEIRRYGKAIIALSPTQTSRLINQINIEHVLENSPITSIFVWCDREIIEEEFSAVIGTKIQWIFNRTKILGIKHIISKYSYSFTISASSDFVRESNYEILDILVSDLRKIYPDFLLEEIKHTRIIHEKLATFSATPDFEKVRSDIPVSINDKLFIAGDWTNTRLPGTLESAAQSGRTAAYLLIKTEKK